jgi:hypothetical protein
MLEHAIKFKEPLEDMVNFINREDLSASAIQYLWISNAEWVMLTEILNFLQPFKEATIRVSGRNYPTISEVIPWYNFLLDHAETTMDITSEILRPKLHLAATAAFNKLEKYYSETSDFYTIATVLDPKLKLEPYKPDGDDIGEVEDTNIILSVFKEELKTYQLRFENANAAGRSSGSSTFSTSSEGSEIMRQVYKRRRVSNSSSDELNMYLSEPVLPIEACSLNWWKGNASRFPTLSRMAKDFLAAPGTSVPSESAFSGGRHTVTDFRGSLNPNTIRALQCLKSWYKN